MDGGKKERRGGRSEEEEWEEEDVDIQDEYEHLEEERARSL